MTAFLKIIGRNFLYRKKRTFLTVLGILIGTTLILTLVLLGEGMERAVSSQLQAFGGDLVFVMPGREDNPVFGLLAGGELRDKDLRVIKDLRGVELAFGSRIKNFRVEYEGEERVVNVSGSPWEETRIVFGRFQGFEIAEGEWPARDDLNQMVLGDLVARERFRNEVRPGDELVIGGKRFAVAGTFRSLGNSDDDSRIYMSLDRFRSLTGERTGVSYIIAKAEEGLEPERLAEDIRFELGRQKGVGDFIVFTSENASQIVGSVLGIIQLVLSVFAAVAVVVGGIGIMNTMFTSVLERTREIGVMKALGSTDGGILSLFLTEAGLLGAIGGLLGVAVSFGFAKGIELAAAARNFTLLEIEFDPLIVAGTLLFAFAIGAFFGAVPAWRASRLQPTEALRYE
jgi:putative ABC transport system permease protein